MIHPSAFADTPSRANSLIFAVRAKPNSGSPAIRNDRKAAWEMNMRTLTKITTGVAATALVCAGLLGAAGTAGAATPTPSAGVTVPGLGSVTLTGKVVSVDGKYVTIVLDRTNRKIVVTWDELTKIVGDIKKDAKVKVVTSTLNSLLGLIKADVITVLG